MNESNPSVPIGFCQCGCGAKTRLARDTDASKGWTKGQPLRYIRGHTSRINAPEYREEDRGYETPCWIWQRGLTSTGYGQCSGPGRLATRAHVDYYLKRIGPIPDGLQLDHLCRVRECCNPAHLEPVTIAENVRRGNLAKLTMAKAREIRASQESNAALAKRYGVDPSSISLVRSGKTWRE